MRFSECTRYRSRLDCEMWRLHSREVFCKFHFYKIGAVDCTMGATGSNIHMKHVAGGHAQGGSKPACIRTLEGQKRYFVM